MEDLLKKVIPTHQINAPIRHAISVEALLNEINQKFPEVSYDNLGIVALQHGVILISNVNRALKSGRDLRSVLKETDMKKKKVRKNKNPK